MVTSERAYAQEGSGASAAPQGASSAGAAAPATGGTPSAQQPVGTPAEVVDAACKYAVTGLGDGKLSAFKSLSADERTALAQRKGAVDLFTCLAVADGQTSYCEVLPTTAKRDCLEQLKLMGELKALPKERIKAQVIYRTCSRSVPNEATEKDCDTIRKAMTARDASVCEGLSKSEGAWGREGLCPALATSDPAKCNGAPEQAQRDTCAALATDDPSRCPKDAAECSTLVSNLATLTKDGLAGHETVPVLAAVHSGRKACAPLVAALQATCVSAPVTPGASTPSVPDAPKEQ
jgi:hypothetical protein